MLVEQKKFGGKKVPEYLVGNECQLFCMCLQTLGLYRHSKYFALSSSAKWGGRGGGGGMPVTGMFREGIFQSNYFTYKLLRK